MADIAHHTILPVITLGLVAFGATMLLTRSAMLETLGEDYILTARAKGIPDWIIRDRHAARNALLPVTTSLVLSLAFVIGGGIVTETIFSWPGMGLVFLQAINVSDIPLAVGALAITGVLALFGHLIADIKNSRLLFDSVRVNRHVPTNADDLRIVLDYLAAEQGLGALDRAWPSAVIGSR